MFVEGEGGGGGGGEGEKEQWRATRGAVELKIERRRTPQVKLAEEQGNL